MEKWRSYLDASSDVEAIRKGLKLLAALTDFTENHILRVQVKGEERPVLVLLR